ncbi:small RNA degrading nuclease 1-like [Iris pallida]|uniref:Small RNA degrading nuclease 1-like n=1 Tax=Iris pallida TaxID=29817 RepID=A0AAX6HUH8_IRIPA|nr:small RNA degrading nuclease 1-like [Iris pallida]
MRRFSNQRAMEQFTNDHQDQESPMQRLVRMTMEHSQYKQNFSFPSLDEEWMVVPLGKLSKAMTSKNMLAIDCEMVGCQDGTEAIVRICAVDQNLKVIFDEKVNPGKAVADYRTNITGIAAEDLEGVTCSLDDIKKSLRKLLAHGTILVGHSLHNDLQALKIDHLRVIDTSYIFKIKDLPASYTPSLNNLCKANRAG